MKVELTWEDVVLLSEAVGTHVRRVEEAIATTRDRSFADELRDRLERLERLRDHLDIIWSHAVAADVEPVVQRAEDSSLSG